MIVDSEIVANAALADLLSASGYPVSKEEAIARYTGHRWIDCHRLIEQESGLGFDCDALGRRLEEAIAARVDDIVAIEGVGSFLEVQMHRRLAIASSSRKYWLDATLKRLGLAGHFGERIFSAAGLPRGKPHPDIYLLAAEQLGARPSACLVIEDHPIGIAAGAAAGMTVIGLLAASHIRDGHAEKARAAGALHTARNYVEVVGILEKIERM